MAEVTKPIALDESFNTTESTPRNIADVLAEGLASANTLANLDDVTINTGTLADKQSLTYNALTGTWVNSTLATPNELNDLSDVTINTPLNKQELLYNDALEVFQNKTTRVELTMAEYNNLVEHDWVLPDVDYYITDAPSMQGTSADLSYDGTTKSVYTKIVEVESDISDLSTVSSSTITSSVTGPAIKIYKCGKMRQLWINTQTYSNSGDVQIGTVPNDSKPANMIRFYFGDKSHYIAIETDGKIISANGETYVVANIVYMVS